MRPLNMLGEHSHKNAYFERDEMYWGPFVSFVYTF